MNPSLLWAVGLVSLVVVALGVIGGLIRRSDAEMRKRTLREREQRERELTKTMRGAFDPPRWWEWGKARDQDVYYGRARPRTGSIAENAGLSAGHHSLSRLYEREGERKRRRRAVIRTLILIGTAVAAGFLFTPTETVRAFELFTVPAVTVVAGVGLFRFGQSPAITRLNGGVWGDVTEALIILTGIGAGILGLVLGVRAYLAW